MAERGLTAAMLSAITAGRLRPALFYEGEFDSGGSPAYLRLWTGVGPIDWDSKTWFGGGKLLSISPIVEPASTQAVGFSVSMSGIDSADVSRALQSMRKKRGGKLWLGLFVVDPPRTLSGGFESDSWVAGNTPSGYSLNQTIAGESQFLRRVGPYGQMEVVNVCQSLDVSSDAEGGWTMSANVIPIDKTKSHLLACWFKRLATGGTAGTAYWGLHSDSASDMLDLAGTPNANPYFLNAVIPSFMPTADKWYLAVGFVHPDGYGTASAGITGVYDPDTNTKVITGTEFKWPSDASACRHRAYHYYNATISGEVQQMTRPVVIENSVAEAPATIAQILAGPNRPIASPYMLRRGRFNFGRTQDDGNTATIQARYEDRMILLEIPRIRRYTTEDQRLRLDGDLGFDQVPELQNAQDTWGPFNPRAIAKGLGFFSGG